MTSRLFACASIATLVFVSCGTGSYQRGFEKASATMARPPADASGPWQGTWNSGANGHHGPLWCMVEPTPAKPGHYDFRYRAGWGSLRFGDYTHSIPARVAGDGSIKLSGEMLLPSGLGVYQVNGRLTRESFNATYRSAADHGTMTLRRPTSPQGPGKD